MFFKFHEEASVSGIDGYKYTLAEGFMANATYNASNECYNPHPDLGNYLKHSRSRFQDTLGSRVDPSGI